MATKSKVEIEISAKDNASKTIKGIGKSLSGLTSAIGTMAKVGATAFVAVGAAASAFGVSAVKASIEAEKEMAKFNATLATMGKVGEKSRESILEMANAAVKLGFDDEQAANSIAKFLKITGDLTMAQRANNLAMDIARAKSMDLETANRVVSLAFAGNARALKEYGIELKDGATKVQALTLMEGIFAGQADAFAKTNAGSIAILNESWDNLKQAIGDVLVQKLKINEVLGWIIEKINWLIALDWAGYWNMIRDSLFGAKDALKAWYEEFFSDTNYIWVFIKDFFIPIWEDLKESVTVSLIAIQEALKPMMPLLSALAKVFGVILLGAIMAIIAIISGLIQLFARLVAILAIVVSAIYKGIVNALSDFFVGIMQVYDAWKKLVELVKKGISGTIKLTKKVFGGDDEDKKEQFGGGVQAGRSYIVGEHRPEVFVPSQSGNIKQLDQVGTGAINVNFNNVSVRSDQDLSYIIETVKRTLARENLYARQGINV